MIVETTVARDTGAAVLHFHHSHPQKGEVEVRRYAKANGQITRHWAVYVSGELLAVCVYKKGAEAVASCLQ